MLTPDERVASPTTAKSTISGGAPELEEQGHVFRTDSDTEVILAGWRQWGPDCLSRFNGMFAFALYDADATACSSPATGSA
jgi:asparagine synthase (glutamine-hydrolysing)